MPEAADLLGTSTTHIRLALVDQEPRDWSPRASVSAWKLREQVRSVLTPAFLHREYTKSEKTLTRIAHETGFPRHVVTARARELDLTVYCSRRPFHIEDD